MKRPMQVYDFVGLAELIYAGSHGMDIKVREEKKVSTWRNIGSYMLRGLIKYRISTL